MSEYLQQTEDVALDMEKAVLRRNIEEEIYGPSAAAAASGLKLDFLPNTVTKMSSIACVITVSLRTRTNT